MTRDRASSWEGAASLSAYETRQASEDAENGTRMGAALDAAAVATWSVDLDGQIVTFDDRKATMVGYDPVDFDTLADFRELIHPNDVAAVDAELADVLDGRETRFEVEYRMRTADGDYRWLRDVGALTGADDGDVQFTGITLDVTADRVATDAVVQKNEALALLNRIVRHDLRNDLNVITGWLELFADDPETISTDRLEELVTVGNRAIDLTESIRDVVTVVESDQETELGVVDLADILTVEIERARAAYPDATIESDPIADVDVVGTPLLASVFRNLLTNAIEHADTEDVTVQVETSQDDDTVGVAVIDDGPGIPDEQKGLLETPDLDAVDHLTHGLGLYLVHSLVDAYGGTTTVTDNDPTGTIFTVALQVA